MQINMIRFGVLAAGLCTCSVAAQTDPTSGFEFVTVGDPGNRHTTDEEAPGPIGTGGIYIGGVDYEYRISRTEVTLEQWLEFVIAYYPFYVERTGRIFGTGDFGGIGIHVTPFDISIDSEFSEHRFAFMSWEYAAYYVNWLHNGKVNELWAFETGVYDASTFYRDDDGVDHHQATHHPDARYWLPTLDEWAKAGYWDPEMDQGQGGYWKYPNGSNTESIPSLLPEDGGQRNAGHASIWPVDVQTFQSVQSPWGVFDMAGGGSEYTETVPSATNLGTRAVMGSSHSDSSFGEPSSMHVLGMISSAGVYHTGNTLRLASAVPHRADLDRNWKVDWFDVKYFLERYLAGDLSVDFDGDGDLDINDIQVFLGLMNG